MKIVPLSFVMLSMLCGACATKQENILKSKGGAHDVEFVSKNAQQGIVGFRATSFRVSKDGNSSIPAACEIEGVGFNAKFTTPALVNLPSYGKDTKPIQLACMVDEKPYSRTLKPKNISAENRKANAIGAGVLVGGVLGGALAGSVTGEKEDDAYSYKPMTLKVD